MIPHIEIDWSLDPARLRAIYEDTKFDDQFHKLINTDVIEIFSPQLAPEPHNIVHDDTMILEKLTSRLEGLICRVDEGAPQKEIHEKFDQIRTLKQPSRLCRKVLKSGDVLFSCNDCGLDGTCVLCIDCFHKSAHKDHNYRMSNTEGGGCCDCGDVEAWKQHPACSDHTALDRRNLRLSDFETIELRRERIACDRVAILEKISLLERGTAEGYFFVVQACLHYAQKILTWIEHYSLPQELAFQEFPPDIARRERLQALMDTNPKGNNYFTVLFNDEVHTYDYVINTLVKILKCPKMTASIMASTVSREGRCFIYRGDIEACTHIKDQISRNREHASHGPLKVEVIHGSVLAHQAFAVKLIKWVKKISSYCDAFRILTAYTLLGPYVHMPKECCNPTWPGFLDGSLLARLMSTNTKVWKEVRVDWNDLFVANLLSEYSIKEQFARLITKMYPQLMLDFINDDHDHSVSILTMTTQLYTVPSLVCMLIEEERALYHIAKSLVSVCEHNRQGNITNFENGFRFDINCLRRGFSIIYDLKHLINVEPTKWTDKLRENVIEAVKVLLSLLKNMQGLDSVRRQVGQHLEYEPEWETGMTLQNRLIRLISRLVNYCRLDEQVLCSILKETQQLLMDFYSFKTTSKELFGHRTVCIQYDVSSSPVSVHLPLTRFAAALIMELMQLRPSPKQPYDETLITLATRNQTNDSSDPQSNSKQSMIELMEPSLRTGVMIAQFRSGMWRRNGYSLVNQILYFSGALMRNEMFDRDILMLQEGGAVCEANSFVIHLLNKFNLFSWVTSESTREPLVGPRAVSFYNDEEILTQTMSLGEEFLQLLLTLVGERYRVGLGKIEPDDVIKNEIIQLLCMKSFTRSDLTQKLYVGDNELDCIKAVANLRRSNESSTGKYELKEELYKRFNPFFYHYNRRQQSAALDAQLKRKKNLRQSLICCPPPEPVELTEQFKNLNELLKCDITLTIIAKILRRSLGPPDSVKECSTKAPIIFTASDLQLDLCLHLIGLGLWEQERDQLGFCYIEAAYEKDIFNLLIESYELAKRSRDLIYWIMQKMGTLVNSMDLNALSEYKRRVYSSVRARLELILTNCDTNKQENKKRNSELAAQRRERILAQMKAKQRDFLSNPSTQQLISETDRAGSSSSSGPNQLVLSTSKPSGRQHTQVASVAHGPADNETKEDCDDVKSMDTESLPDDCERSPERHLCILCRDEQIIGFNKPTMVLLAYTQRSAVLSKNRKERRIPNYALTPTNRLRQTTSGHTKPAYSFSSDDSSEFDATYMPADNFFGPHVSTCGHAMHHSCWEGYFNVLHQRESSRPNRTARSASFDLDKKEILCPLCESISNSIIPLLPDFTCFAERPLGYTGSVFNSSNVDKSAETLSTFLNTLRSSVDTLNQIRQLNESMGETEDEDKYVKLSQPKQLNEVLEELSESQALTLREFIASMRADTISSSTCTNDLLLAISVLPGKIYRIGLDMNDQPPPSVMQHARVFMMISWSIAYTIQANERAIRFKGAPLFEEMESPKSLCLGSLIRFALGSMLTHQSDQMQSLLVKKLRYLLIADEHLSAPLCCLDIDVYEMFVSLFILLQKLYSHLDDSYPLLGGGGGGTSGRSSQTSLATDLLSSSFKSCSSKSSTETEQSGHNWTTRAYDHEYFRNLLHLMVMVHSIQLVISIQTDVEASSLTSADQAQRETDVIMDESDGEESQIVHSFYQDVILKSGHPSAQMSGARDRPLAGELKYRLLPFLRSCAIFFYHLSHIKPPKLLQTMTALNEGVDFPSGAASGRPSLEAGVDFEKTAAEFTALCSYMDLPSDLGVLLSSREVRQLASSWLRHPRVLMLIKSALDRTADIKSDGQLMPVKLIRQPHRVNRLIDLPYDYSELVDKVSDFTCPTNRNEDSRTPTMCLVCGVMLCSQSFCCQRDLNDLASNYQQVLRQLEETRRGQTSAATLTSNLNPAISGRLAVLRLPVHVLVTAAIAGNDRISQGLPGSGSPAATGSASSSAQIHQQLVGSCTYHAHECCAGVGIFLRIRNCQILLLSGRSKGSYMPAPYIDDHGETDFGLMRGNPLHLNKEHYERLQQMWMNHSLPEQIARTLEYSTYASNINWHFH